PAIELGEFELDLRIRRISVPIMLRTFGLDRDRVAHVEGHERHVASVASHIAEGSGAEIPPTTPSERMVDLRTRVSTPRRWAEPDFPIKGRRHGLDRRPMSALRPDRSVRPDVNFFNGPNLPCSNLVGRLAERSERGVLITHLRSHALLARD